MVIWMHHVVKASQRHACRMSQKHHAQHEPIKPVNKQLQVSFGKEKERLDKEKRQGMQANKKENVPDIYTDHINL